MTKENKGKLWQKDPMPQWWQKDYGRITSIELLTYIALSFNLIFTLTMPQYVRESLL